MNHTERLAICEVCKNKEFSPKLGLVCALTSERPAFEGNCEDYENDPKMVARSIRAEESRKNLSDGGAGDFHKVDESNTSPWGIIVAIIVVMLILLKWLWRCDRIMN